MAETTSLVADYVLMEKLRAFLRATFGQGNYVIDIGDDYVEVSAPRKLTEAEKSNVTLRQ